MKIVLSDRVKAVVEDSPLSGLPVEEHTPLPRYPNPAGLVKCVYCTCYREKVCKHGHQPDGISLLRRCGDFRFNRAAYDDFYSNVKG
jgi:hypothetical protein